MGSMLMPLRRYADFSGRSRRREFWTFTLFVLLVEFVLYGWIFAAAAGADNELTTMVLVPLVLVILFVLAVILPSLAVAIRRLHDTGRSGLYILLLFVPVAGAIAILIFMCIEGTKGPNRYGPDPKTSISGGA